jgi:hypothetical protein
MKKNIIYIASGVTLGVIIGVTFNYFANIPMSQTITSTSVIDIIAASTIMFVFLGFVICGFLLGKKINQIGGEL